VKNFASLHNHTEFSLLDGAQRCPQLAGRCKEMGDTAVGQTDHGTMRGFIKFHKACKDAGIKPVFGVEMYLCRDRHQRGLTKEQVEEAVKDIPSKKDQREAVKEMEERLGVRKRFHICFFAKDDVGLRNLFKLSSIGWTEGFYYRPRIDLAAVREHREGLILATACVGGVLAQYVPGQRYEEMLDTLDELVGMFGQDLYLEVMPHGFQLQQEVNEATVQLARARNLPLLATNDAHYALAEHWQLHELMLAMQSNATWDDPKRWRFPGGHDYYLKTREEMEVGFAQHHPVLSPAEVAQALDNTVELAGRCDARYLDEQRVLLPKVQLDPAEQERFLRWAAATYPDQYELDPPQPCCADLEAPSTAPYVVGSDTSKAAAEALAGKLGSVRREVYDFLFARDGATCEEVELGLRPDAPQLHQTIGPRIRELVQAGVAYDSGERRQTTHKVDATVWKARRP